MQSPGKLKKIVWLTLLLMATGCQTVRLDNSKRLINRPDFPQAKQTAPEWCRDALKTINALEMEIERK